MSGTFQGVNTLQFSPDNKYVQAFSGVQTISNTETTLLEVSTNSEYFYLTLKYGYGALAGAGTSDDFIFRIYLDNIEILSQIAKDATEPDDFAPIVILPPFTTLKTTAENLSGSASREISVILNGTVHGAIEQFSLEVKE
tara:strand:- start:112 stop:531 length:420 start_codon:yes stop_codon:yes gene_type:complete